MLQPNSELLVLMGDTKSRSASIAVFMKKQINDCLIIKPAKTPQKDRGCPACSVASIPGEF
jgi:hypothetical protein